MSETTSFVALDFPLWMTWRRRKGATIDGAKMLELYPDMRHMVRVDDPDLGYRFERVGSVNRCGWCASPCPGRRTSWCSDACSAKFYRVWTWQALAKYIYERDEGTCQRCGTDDPGEPVGARYSAWEVDHMHRIADGGTDDPANLRLLCRACHVAVGYEQRALASTSPSGTPSEERDNA